jgi:hypothetical protein
VSTYRYLATDVLSGEIVADNMPVIVQSAQRQINGIGQLTGTLQMNISDISTSAAANNIAALEPWKCVFWIIQNNVPIWAGPVTAWNPTTLVGAQLPFTASTLETIFQYRIVDSDVDFENEDVATMFYGLGEYGLGLAGTDNTTNARIAGFSLNDPNLLTGITGSFTQTGANFQSVYNAWNTLTNTYDVEFTIDPSWATQVSGAAALQQTLRVGSEIGRKYSATGLMVQYPSMNCLDYWYQRQSTSVANQVLAYGTSSASSATTYISDPASGGTDSVNLSEGYPLLQMVVQAPNPINSQAAANQYATNVVQTTTVNGQTTPVLVLGAGGFPQVSDIQLGDECIFLATSPLHPATNTGAPGLQQLGRITGWTLYPPSPGVSETTQVTLGGLGPVASN